MHHTIRRQFSFIAGALLASGLFMAGTAQAADSSQAKTVHLRGQITQVSDSGFTMKTDDGKTRKIAVGQDTGIAGVVESSLDEVTEGTFIGTANVDDGSGHKALEVVVFPESMKGTGLGDYAWDLSPSEVKSSGSSQMSMDNSSSMTNGTVESTKSPDNGSKMSSDFSMGGSTMTNGTVTESNDGDQMQVKVDYGDGSKMITIPKDVPVVAVQKGSQSDIKKDAHVFVVAPAGDNDPVQAKRVLVGIDGTVPPM
ncbi:metal ABC transporter permease [Salinisphaera sp. T31B1]|uniref:metal ABC transporter permease n=1 Tax=Salinisphaera sp. T31B1 TaxID=727963 RepID=UPI00333F1924